MAALRRYAPRESRLGQTFASRARGDSLLPNSRQQISAKPCFYLCSCTAKTKKLFKFRNTACHRLPWWLCSLQQVSGTIFEIIAEIIIRNEANNAKDRAMVPSYCTAMQWVLDSVYFCIKRSHQPSLKMRPVVHPANKCQKGIGMCPDGICFFDTYEASRFMVGAISEMGLFHDLLQLPFTVKFSDI